MCTQFLKLQFQILSNTIYIKKKYSFISVLLKKENKLSFYVQIWNIFHGQLWWWILNRNCEMWSVSSSTCLPCLASVIFWTTKNKTTTFKTSYLLVPPFHPINFPNFTVAFDLSYRNRIHSHFYTFPASSMKITWNHTTFSPSSSYFYQSPCDSSLTLVQ